MGNWGHLRIVRLLADRHIQIAAVSWGLIRLFAALTSDTSLLTNRKMRSSFQEWF